LGRPAESSTRIRWLRNCRRPKATRLKQVVGPAEIRTAPFSLACRTRSIYRCWPRPAVVRAAIHLHRRPRVRPSASTSRCDGLETVSFHHHTVRWRLVPLHVHHPEPVRFGGVEAAVDQVFGRLGGRVTANVPPVPAPVDPGDAGGAYCLPSSSLWISFTGLRP